MCMYRRDGRVDWLAFGSSVRVCVCGDQQRTHRRVNTAALEMWCRHTTQRAFRGWRSLVQATEHKRQISERAIKHWYFATLRRIVRRWRQWACARFIGVRLRLSKYLKLWRSAVARIVVRYPVWVWVCANTTVTQCATNVGVLATVQQNQRGRESQQWRGVSKVARPALCPAWVAIPYS